MVLICVSLMINSVEHIFSYVCWPSVYLLWKNIYSGLLPIFALGSSFFDMSCMKWSESHSVVSNSVTPWAIQSMEFSRPEYQSGQPLPSTGDLPNPGLEPRSSALQVDSLPAGPYKGSPRILGWVAYPFSSRSSQPRNRTRVACIAGGFFTN